MKQFNLVLLEKPVEGLIRDAGDIVPNVSLDDRKSSICTCCIEKKYVQKENTVPPGFEVQGESLDLTKKLQVQKAKHSRSQMRTRQKTTPI